MIEHYQSLYASTASQWRLPLPRPLLYIHGLKDGCIGADVINQTKSAITNDVRIIEIPNVGHFPQLEAPGLFNTKVVEFLLDPLPLTT